MWSVECGVWSWPWLSGLKGRDSIAHGKRRVRAERGPARRPGFSAPSVGQALKGRNRTRVACPGAECGTSECAIVNEQEAALCSCVKEGS